MIVQGNCVQGTVSVFLCVPACLKFLSLSMCVSLSVLSVIACVTTCNGIVFKLSLAIFNHFSYYTFRFSTSFLYQIFFGVKFYISGFGCKI